jgi:hypothetical protein
LQIAVSNFVTCSLQHGGGLRRLDDKRLSFQHLDHKNTPEDNAKVCKAKELVIDAPADEQ